MAVTWGLDPKAKAISVWYEGSDTIYEGSALCYNWDTTDNWMGVSSADLTAETGTTAEGYQNEGKFIRVEKPATANLAHLAGFVVGNASGFTGPGRVDIYVPNGAIVPVRTDLNCTIGTTVLGLVNADYDLSGGGRPVAIAQETVDRGTAGIVLARVCPDEFVYSKGTFKELTGSIAHTMQSIFENTSGSAAGLLVHNTLSGIMASGNAWGGLFYTNINAVMTGNCYIRGLLSQVNIGAAVNGPCHISAIHAQLSGSSEVANIEHMCALWAEVTTYKPTTAGTDLADAYSIVKLSNGAPAEKGPNEVFYVYGGNGVDDLFKFDTCLNGGGATDHFIYPHGTGALAYVKNTTGAILKCKVDVDGTDYYIMLYSDPVEAR